MKPHKHAEVIHAWADGAQVQVKMYNGVWLDIERHHWNVDCEFRIKPAEKVVRWLWAYLSIVKGRWATNRDYMTDGEARDYFGIYKQKYKKLDYTRQEFDE